jgi:hypothetical protein
VDEEQPPGPPGDDEELYEISAVDDVEIPVKWQTVASYELELPVRCPHCRNPIRTLKVVKLSRSKVAFTSTLPRTGRAFICSQCECILSVETGRI